MLKAATPEPKINFVGLASIVSASGTTTTAGAIGAGASATAGVVPIVLDGFSDIAINGNVSCFTSSNSRNNATVQSVKYRIRTNPGKAWSEWQTISEENANFSLNLSSDSLPLGISVVEFLAQDSLGQTGSNAVFVKKVSPLAEGEKLTSPQVLWIEGENFYFTANYRGTLEGESFQMVYRSSLNFGTTNLSASVTDEAGKNYSSSCVAKRQSTISSFIDKIGEKKYVSGMEIPLASSMASSSSGEQSALVSVVVECPVALSSIKYNFANQGEKTISAKSILPSGENRYEIQFPISSTEYKTHDLIVTALSADGTSQTIKGTVSIVQADFPQELKKIQEKTYWALPSSGTIKTGESIFGYANVVAPIRATISNGGQGLSVKTEGNNIILTAEKSGIYSNVVVSVVDAEGISYNSEALNFSSDSICPTVKINAPLNMAWVQNKIELSGVASDDFGVAKIEWSIDGKQTWNAFSSTSSFSQSIDISSFEDGLIGLDVRATDRAGNEGFAHVCAQKRTTPPQIDVLVPCENDIVNGMTLLVFKVQDSLSILRALYGGDTNKALKVSHYMPVMVGTNEYPISNEMSFVFTDKAGNSTVLKDWKFKVDKAGDLTRAEIHIPSEGEAITDDFVVSGVVMDDDGDCHIFYKIDNGNYIALEGWKNSFSIPLSIKDFSDNEHTISVYGTDIHGVSGNVAVRMFKVSLEEPKGAIVNPSFDKTVKDKVRISGWASDKNGIKKVQVSTDNGNTWNDAVGGAEWYYDFDTRVINDGTHTIFIKIFDNCGIQAIYSNLINIDNQKPEIRMELPLDGSIVSKNLFISGYIADNIKITKLGLNITSLDPKISVPQSLARINMESEGIVTKVVDVSSLSNGVYNVELVGEDAAGNMTRVSRNIEINKKADASHVDILTPFTGSHISGEFDISGMAESEFSYEKLELYIDGKLVSETELSPTGYFKFAVPGTQQEKSKNAKKTDKKSADGKIDSDGKTSGGETSDVAVADENGTETEVQVPRLADGLHKIQVRGKVTGGSVILSPEVTVDYKYAGPWIKIDNFSLGDFAMNRPKITGTAGYNLTEEESAIAKKGFKLISSERKYDIMTKSLEKVEVSWDNGQSFETLGKKKNWNFRVENEYLKDGFHFVIVRAVFKNGEIATQHLVIQIDNKKPSIRLISPVPLGHYNGNLIFSGLFSDETNLKDVSITMRKGDKSMYEMPSIFQGMYFDAHVLGASMYDVGLGFSFFDNNVKLQAQFGQMTDDMYVALCNLYGIENGGMRYGGNIIGVKLLANIFDLPFKYYFGPDWEWLGMSFAIGADFSIFTQTQANKAQVLSAIIAQLEFPRITIPQAKVFGTYSFYTEYQLWFIPSDIDDDTVKSVVNQLGFGLRVYLF